MEIALLIFCGSIVGMTAMIVVRNFFPAPSWQQTTWYKINIQSTLKMSRSFIIEKTRPIGQFFLRYIFLTGRALRIGLTFIYRKIHRIVTRHLDHRPTDFDRS